ncbi:PFAM Peptidase family M3 [Fragilaria crotonensis]|nr:PFAM Peptidase family M3 [Fragilaria crotonensis]
MIRSFKQLERFSRCLARKAIQSSPSASIKSNFPLLPVNRYDALTDQRRDFFWFNSTNPILELAKKNESQIDFSHVTPRQLLKASSEICTEYQNLLPSLEYDKFKNLTDLVDFVESKITELKASSESIEGIATLMFNMNTLDSGWSKAYMKVYREQRDAFRNSKRTVATAAQRYMASTTDGANELKQLNQLIQLSTEKGAKLSEQDIMNVLHGAEQELGAEDITKVLNVDEQGREEQDTWSILRKADQQLGDHVVDQDSLNVLNDAEQQLADIFLHVDGNRKATSATKETLQNIYTYIAIKQKQANLLGYDTHVDRAFHGRMLPREKVEALLVEVSERTQQALSKSLASSKQEDDVTLSDYLTLDGTLQGLYALSRAMFGIVISEDSTPRGWHMDVRLFHATNDNGEKLGSFYLDPYRRPDKKRGAFMGPLTSDSVYLSTDVEPPLWDHLPIKIEIRNAMSIFHEFGHVLQYLLADADKRKWLGTSYSTMEIVEAVPQFMQHWVLNDSVLQTLAHLSSETKIPEELIRRVQEQYRRDKIEGILFSVFMGHLELEMFSNRSDGESLVALQRRLADRFIPHRGLPQSDLSPMTRLVEDNARGTTLAAYRYLMTEVISTDIFQSFNQGNIPSEEEMRRLGGKFKDVLLKPGFYVDGKKVLQEFCGRDSLSTEGFFRMYKL